MFRFACRLVLCSLFAFPVQAQNEADSLDTIVVTGTRIGYQELKKTPAVSLTKPGDFLVQNITLYNDSRDESARRKELHETIAKMLAASGGRYAVLHNGAYRLLLDRSNYQVEPEEDEDRDDSNLIRLQVRTDLGGDPGRASEVIAGMRRYIGGVAKVGRTEIELDGDSGLAMSRPERYRYEIIQAIAEDARKLVDAMGMPCKVRLEGLNQRIEWQRASAAELLLYIPYSMDVSDCQKASAR